MFVTGQMRRELFQGLWNWAGAVCPLAIVVQEQKLLLGIPLTNQPKLWPKSWPWEIQLCFANLIHLAVSLLTQFLSLFLIFALCLMPHFCGFFSWLNLYCLYSSFCSPFNYIQNTYKQNTKCMFYTYHGVEKYNLKYI